MAMNLLLWVIIGGTLEWVAEHYDAHESQRASC